MTCLDCGDHRPPMRRGLCNSCYERHRRAGTLDTLRTTLPGVYVVAEWEHLSSFGLTRAEVAQRLGMTKTAFEKALARHQRRQAQEAS